MFITLEVSKVPAGGDEVRPHPLDSVHEHSGTSERGCLAIFENDASGVEPRPEPMDDITLGFPNIRPEVRETSLRTLADLETWDSSRSLNFHRDLELVTGSSEDGVRLLELGSRGGFMRDGELVRFAGTPVFTRVEVGDIDRFPGRLLGVRIVNLDN